MFYSIDGVDGAGKTVQLKLLCEYLTRQGKTPVVCRDPGSTPLSESLREIILHEEQLVTGRTSQLFLFMAARAQLVEEVIEPALKAGRTVVCDRFLLANIAYQGYGGGLDPDTIREIGKTATRGIQPDLTFVLDLPVETAATRLNGRELDRLEKENRDFKQRVRDGFRLEAARHPESIVLIDATQSIEQIHRAIVSRIV